MSWTDRVLAAVSDDGTDRGRGTAAACVDLGELRAEQENLRRVIDPQQHHDQCTGRAVAGGYRAVGR